MKINIYSTVIGQIFMSENEVGSTQYLLIRYNLKKFPIPLFSTQKFNSMKIYFPRNSNDGLHNFQCTVTKQFSPEGK